MDMEKAIEHLKDRIEIRCIGCGKLLGKVPTNTEAEIEMKCSKCKEIHNYKIGRIEKCKEILNF